MDQVKDVNRYDNDCLDLFMHRNMVSDIDVTSMMLGKIKEGNIVLNLGVRQDVLTSYIVRVWNGFAISLNPSAKIIKFVKRGIHDIGSQRRALLLQASVGHIPLRKECIDIVISMFTTRGQVLEEARPLFQECNRVLTKTGRFVLVDWVFDPKNEIQDILLELREIATEKRGVEERLFNYKDYCEVLEKTGFDIEEIRFFTRNVSLERFNSLDDKRAIDLLEELSKVDLRDLQIKLALISSRVKR
jgi:ubiquinone/menaquinone biosynthesis C-methylase UbiE